MKRMFLLATSALLFAHQAKAVDVQPYVGADYVYSWANLEDSEYFKDHFQAINVSAGIMATSVMGLELSYQQSQQNKKSSVIGQTKIEYKILALDGAYYAGVLENLQIVGTAGLGYYEAKGNLKCHSVKISSAKKKWGSCSSRKDILYSWQLICLSFYEIDYVCVHELTHTIHMDHSKQFYADLARVLPDYKSREASLHEHNGILTLI